LSRPVRRRVNPPPTQFIADKLPERIPFSIEIQGEPDMGKTHLAATFCLDERSRKVLFLDTEEKAWIVLKKFPKDSFYWKRVKSFADIRNGIMWACENPEINTIVIDSGADLRDLAVQEWSREHGGKKPIVIDQSGAVSTVLYAQVYEKIDSLVNLVKSSNKYLVVTARMKDEWVNNIQTGRRVRDGYKKFPWDLSIAIRIVYGIEEVVRTERSAKVVRKVHFPDFKFGKVLKNNFHGIDQKKMLNYQKPYLFDLSFNGICEELLKPWGDGVPIGKELETILKEAEEWLKSRK